MLWRDFELFAAKHERVSKITIGIPVFSFLELRACHVHKSGKSFGISRDFTCQKAGLANNPGVGAAKTSMGCGASAKRCL